jgi:glyoxylase-like metal-dependent hydrolase (beta-lactamase superfamily II)
MLVDTGFPGERDATRIAAAAKDAGVSKIDYLLITHYHGDHVGGVLELAKRLPIQPFIDHAPAPNRLLTCHRAIKPMQACAINAGTSISLPNQA